MGFDMYKYLAMLGFAKSAHPNLRFEGMWMWI